MHNTVEPQFNEPLQNEVLEITNGYRYPNTSRILMKNNETSL